MLPTYLKAVPCTKFILIEDNLKQRGDDLLAYLINHHQKSDEKIVYCEFEFNRNINKRRLLSPAEKRSFVGLKQDAEEDVTRLCEVYSESCVLIVDSLAHAVYRFGARRVYQIMHKLTRSPNIKQIIATLHTDLFDEDDDVFKYLEHLASLHVCLKPKFMSEYSRAAYTYKKSGGKTIADIEQYTFENEELVTKPIHKIDPKSVVQVNMISPEDLTTFKIGLNEAEKKVRDDLVLPFMPKDDEKPKEEMGGQIFYDFDEVDDWDEEDPDDDLDI